MDAPDLGLTAYSKTICDLGKKELPKGVRFVELLYRRFLDQYPQKEGIVVTTKSDFADTFGFGSSSAVTVAFAKALTTLYNLNLTNKQLFDLCYQAVLDVQGVGSGFDLAAAIWGGTLYYIPPAKVVTKLKVNHLPLVVGYTGIKADTPTLVRMVAGLKDTKPRLITSIFKNINHLVEAAVVSINQSDWTGLGDLFNQNQQLLKQLGVSSTELDRLIQSSLKAGSAGAKLSGAGGGDCMIATYQYDQSKSHIESAITAVGGQVMPVVLNAPGVRVE